MEKEIVICAALKMEDGYVVRGHRHHDCLRTASQIPRYSEKKNIDRKQGFITSRNRFVDRYAGYALQKAAGIKSEAPEGYHAPKLFSEDLY